MNDHDAERIAAAMHAARPDWPTASVLTLIRRNLIDRPRRDVFVALAWIASEPNSHTPARVLENGPWWKAAGVDGGGSHGHPLADKGPWCKDCGRGEHAPIHRSGDHAFALWPAQFIQQERRAELIAAARSNLAAPPQRTDVVVDERLPCGDGCSRGAGHTGPHSAPPAEEPA